jgi:2-methylcitrate dehydratase PrpD
VTNALAMGARAQHDEHPPSITHFGSAVLPPLLATAEQHDTPGQELLLATIAGYEIGARIGAASVKATSARGFRPTGLYGPFAAAAACGRALRLTPEQMTSALALAGNASAGLTQTWVEGTDEWRSHTAFAGRNGYLAARLAKAGARGAGCTLEGRSGFLRAFAGLDLDPDRLDRDLFATWAVDDVLLKVYPVCAFNQSIVQQAIELRRDHGVRPGEIQRIAVRMNPADLTYPGLDDPQPPRTRAAALMNVRTCLGFAHTTVEVTTAQLDVGTN